MKLFSLSIRSSIIKYSGFDFLIKSFIFLKLTFLDLKSRNVSFKIKQWVSNLMKKLILLRHGESIWNQENRFTGTVDIDLSEKGIKEAIAVGKKFRGDRISHVFCSSLLRARKTAELVMKFAYQCDYLFTQNFALNERNYGKLQGMNKNEAIKKYGADQIQRWRRGLNEKPPNGESLEETSTRIVTYYDNFIKPFIKLGNLVMIVSHGNSLRALIVELEKRNGKKNTQLEIEIPNCVPIIYEFTEDKNELFSTHGY